MRAFKLQQGLALPMVCAVLLLVGLLVVQCWRQLANTERMLQVRAERAQSQRWAQAVVQAALRDVQAAPTLREGQPNWRQQMGDMAQQHVFFPRTLAEHAVLRQRLGAAPCREGICAPDGPQPLTSAQWQGRLDAAMKLPPDHLPPGAVQAVYWVEVLARGNPVSPAAFPFHYRFTALVQARATSSALLMQAVWRPDHDDARTGTWLSWSQRID